MNKIKIEQKATTRFTLNDWYLNNRIKYRFAEDQQKLSDRIINESDCLRGKSADLLELNKTETNHQIEERINEIEFRNRESQINRCETVKEIEALEMYKERIADAITPIKFDALRISKECLMFRENRLGIDLVTDLVDRELIKEIEMIEAVLNLLHRTFEQSNEQLRKLRSAVYFIDRDLEDKANVLMIDKHIASIKETSLHLNTYQRYKPLTSSKITMEEWKSVTDRNFDAANNERNNSAQLRSYIDKILTQTCQDLRDQYNFVNESFSNRISETKNAKSKLELEHCETTRQVNEMMRNITRIETAIKKTENYLALAQTRLDNRLLRQCIELCKDSVEAKLINEVTEINSTLDNLQRKLHEAKAMLRLLLKTQIQLEEDINIKTNTLEIDEVQCMALRRGMDYQFY